MRPALRSGKGSQSGGAAGSESPSGAMAAAVLLWLPLWSESAAQVPEAELKPTPPQSVAARRPGSRTRLPEPVRGPGRTLCARVCAPRPRESRADRPDARASPSPSFLCVCVCAWRRNY